MIDAGHSVEAALTDALRVIIEQEPASGAWNMAVDAVLLETALARGQGTLRWYRWAEPTLSLGHFQAADDPAIEERFAALPRVQRLSGGGAILHDQEWTYSFALSSSHPLTGQPSRLYQLFHEAVIQVLRQFGIDARMRGDADRSLNHHFLCFSRGDSNDVVFGAQKVLGSAQRRRRGAVLQHGAMLLRASPYAPEFPGILDLLDEAIDEAHLFAELTARTAEALGVAAMFGELSPGERQRAALLSARQST